ncbi:hypothetical protein [Pseudomonas sp. Larv2_ips]|uniref:hypothetical protein n=1 Tax=Pseudomonas sp. Larv2_ips TaxID=1896942 RepID=UPI0013006672|nr:hypothetical protein [Pseudomonas sp. Larv2_ips]
MVIPPFSSGAELLKEMLSEEKYSGVRFRSLSAPEIDERIRPVNGRFWHTYSG